jgi:hypothetical protein
MRLGSSAFSANSTRSKAVSRETQIANDVSSAGTSPFGNVAVYFNLTDPQTQMRGTYGYYTVTLQGTIGQASSKNDALFFQDSWAGTPTDHAESRHSRGE